MLGVEIEGFYYGCLATKHSQYCLWNVIMEKNM